MIIVTWNVLHRVHAENWGEDLSRHPDEATRQHAIATRLSALAADVTCLQEVSGDQLAALGGGPRVHALDYPRVPRPRSGRSPLSDPKEHLVTVADGAVLERAVFASDPGKGFLSVRLSGSGAVVVNTHVSFGPKCGAQLAQIAEHVRAQRGPVIVCGDFNDGAAGVLAALGPGFVLAPPRLPALPTRPRPAGASGKSQDIDHVIVWGGAARRAEVLDGGGLSDHNPVLAEV